MPVVWLHSWFIAATRCDGGEKHKSVPVSLSAAVRRNQWLIRELDLFHCQQQSGGVPPEFCTRRPENLGSYDNISHCQPYCTKENTYFKNYHLIWTLHQWWWHQPCELYKRKYQSDSPAPSTMWRIVWLHKHWHWQDFTKITQYADRVPSDFEWVGVGESDLGLGLVKQTAQYADWQDMKMFSATLIIGSVSVSVNQPTHCSKHMNKAIVN